MWVLLYMAIASGQPGYLGVYQTEVVCNSVARQIYEARPYMGRQFKDYGCFSTITGERSKMGEK